MVNQILMIICGASLLFFLSGIRIVRPNRVMLVERLGKYIATKEQGFAWIIPIIDKGTKVNITERKVDVPPQGIITEDNLNVEVDAVVYYQVHDAYKAAYNVDHHQSQLVSLARTTLRAVIGKMTFADANKDRDKINKDVAEVLEKETNSYGVKVLRVEIQKIDAPENVQQAMNSVVVAERKKIAAQDFANAKAIEAEGEKRASIEKAQGEKQSLVLKAEGQKQSSILKAEGESKAFDLINKSFTGNAQKLKELEVTQASLENNTKVVLTENGITPQIILGNLPTENNSKR